MNPPSTAPSDAADPPGDTPLRVVDLGRLAYGPALTKQRRINQRVIDGDDPPTLLLLEHEPVITISHRRGAERHLLASRDRLEKLGIALETTDRGGDITYHGPGQLVAYPILRLTPLGLNLSRYMRMLEQVVIDTLAHFNVAAARDSCATGVWVPIPGQKAPTRAATTDENTCPQPQDDAPASAKICAMGVRVRKNTSMHGLALNVAPNLAHFQTIVPCGLQGRGVTSLAQLLGDRCPGMAEVKAQLAAQMRRAIDARLAARA